MIRALALLAGVALASASSDLYGTWYKRKTTGTGPPTSATSWGASAEGFGSMFVIGGSGASNGTFRFDWETSTWSRIADVPNAPRAPSLTYTSSGLIMFGGETSTGFLNQMRVLRTVDPSGGWTPIPTTGTPKARDGHTVTDINGVLYLIGGWDETQYFRSIWAYDLGQLLNPHLTSTHWIEVADEAASDTPTARNGHSVAVYENRAYLFGGFKHNVDPGHPYTNCADPTEQCVWFNDLWMWTPNTGIPKKGVHAAWEQITIASSSPVPPARYGHVATFIENNRMIVFGGSAQGGALNDLWQFDEHTRGWAQLLPVGSTPKAASTPLGGRIGRHLLIFQPTLSDNAIMDYSPYDTQPGTAQPTSPCVDHTDLAGINAGLVIAILIGIAQLSFGVLVWLMLRKGSPAPGYSSMDA